MADAVEKPQAVDGEKREESVTAVDMKLESETPHNPAASESQPNGVHRSEEDGTGKRGRGEGKEEEEENGVTKKQKAEKSVEEERLEKLEEKGELVGETKEEEEGGKGGEGEVKEGAAEEKDSVPVNLGPKVFNSAVEMFDYFFELLHYWSPDLDINKYEHMVLLDLIKKGHAEPDEKIGEGVRAFQVRFHPLWKSRCFFVVRVDGSYDDISFRKCVDRILPLPDNMKTHGGKKNGGGCYGSGGGRGGGRGGRRRRGGFGK